MVMRKVPRVANAVEKDTSAEIARVPAATNTWTFRLNEKWRALRPLLRQRSWQQPVVVVSVL